MGGKRAEFQHGGIQVEGKRAEFQHGGIQVIIETSCANSNTMVRDPLSANYSTALTEALSTLITTQW